MRFALQGKKMKVQVLPASHQTMQTVQTYLDDLLKNAGKAELSEHEQKIISTKGLDAFIFQRLTTKKFRKTKLEPGCAERTKNAISLKMADNKPIKVVFPQGGYKLWRFPSSPTADWAEFFNIAYVLEYLAPIAEAYTPGVELVYYMHTLLPEIHDNLPTAEIQAYVDSFQKLIDTFSQYLPENISITILRDADIYPRDKYVETLENGVSEAKQTYSTFTEEKKQRFRSMAELNIKWNGAEDWESLSEADKEQKIQQAALYEIAATSELKRVAEIVKAPENVLVFTAATPLFINIGSTKASIAKYWVGFGVLQPKGESYLPVILTPSQYQTIMQNEQTVEKVSVIGGENFQEIMIIKNKKS